LLDGVDGAAIAEFAGIVVVVVVADALAGGFTANWVPVSTVTSAPFVTWLGSKAKMTEPVMDRATFWAAASTVGERDP
jgi:hypothetical protein